MTTASAMSDDDSAVQRRASPAAAGPAAAAELKAPPEPKPRHRAASELKAPPEPETVPAAGAGPTAAAALPPAALAPAAAAEPANPATPAGPAPVRAAATGPVGSPALPTHRTVPPAAAQRDDGAAAGTPAGRSARAERPVAEAEMTAAIGAAASREAASVDTAVETGSEPGGGAAATDALRRVAPGGRRAGTRRVVGLLRTALAGALDTGAFDTLEASRRTVRAVRAPLAQPRSIAVVAGRGGVGNTTTAVGLASVLAALRDDETVVVGASGSGGASSSARLRAPLGTPGETPDRPDAGRAATGPGAADGDPAADRDPPDAGPPDAEPEGEFRAGPFGPYVVDGGPDDGDLGPRLDALRRRYAVIVADAGNELTHRAHSAVGHAGQVVVVTDAGGGALEATRRVFERLASAHRADVARTAVVAVVGGRAADRRRLMLRLGSELGVDPAQIVEVPHDEGLAGPGHFDPARLARATRWAYVTVAATVLTAGAPAAVLDVPAGPSRDVEVTQR